MTIKQCYEAMGADYENVSQRIPSEAMIKKFATKFPEDESFTQLTDALKNGNAEIAFRAVHTMKGLCLTLGLSNLTAPASELTELLRNGCLDGSETLYEKTNISSEYLTEADLLNMQDGLEIYGKEELNQVIEDFE